MNTNESSIGDRNVERLIGTSYKPELPDPAFVQNVEEHLLFTAHQLARETQNIRDTQSKQSLEKLQRRFGWSLATAAAVVVGLLVWYAQVRTGTMPHEDAITADRHGALIDVVPPQFIGLTPRPRPATETVKLIAVGETLITKAGERRRVTLADGSILYLNQGTEVKQVAERRLELVQGEVYVEVRGVSFQLARDGGDKSQPIGPIENRPHATFTIATPTREVTALGTHFAVQADPKQTGVLVTQGKVKVSGIDAAIEAGQQLTPGSHSAQAAPRVSHLLDWTRELMAATCSPLVPGNKHAGGALIAVDPAGQEVRLSLRKFLIDVHIEDGFARTTIDQTYFNNSFNQLEGTFYFPLPADATLSRLAMYVENGKWCDLKEAGMVERDLGRDVYETIRYARRDPALLEWVDGSTFKMRVFPLEGRKEKRVILSYTQRLPELYGTMHYRFPAGHNMELVRDWQFKAVVKNGSKYCVTSGSHPNMNIEVRGDDFVAQAADRNTKPNRDVTLEIAEVRRAEHREVPDNVRNPAPHGARLASFTHEGHEYLMLRYRPDLRPASAKPQAARRDWVVLFESSANRDPLLARAQIDVVRTLLENVEHDDTFSILTAGTRVRLFDAEPRPATKQNVDEAVKFLEKAHLIGALDLEKALRCAAPILTKAKNPHLVHVGAGGPALGERRDDVLAKLIPDNTCYVGVGVGKRWSRSFMKLAAERSGGLFTQINPDEPIAWRTFELLATLNTPRLMELAVSRDDDPRNDKRFLTETTSLSQGEELCAVTRIPKDGSLPGTITVSGKIAGQPFAEKIVVENVAANAGYLPRQWAKLEIDRLLAEDSEKNKPAIVALSKASYVMSPFTSLLVLETDADYEKYHVDRGRKDHWALYACPEKIETVHELDVQASRERQLPEEKKPSGKRTPQEVLESILVRVPPALVKMPGEPERENVKAMTAWEVVGLIPMQRSLPDLLDISQKEAELKASKLITVLNDNFAQARRVERLDPEKAQSILRDSRLLIEQDDISLTESQRRYYKQQVDSRLRDIAIQVYARKEGLDEAAARAAFENKLKQDALKVDVGVGPNQVVAAAIKQRTGEAAQKKELEKLKREFQITLLEKMLGRDTPKQGYDRVATVERMQKISDTDISIMKALNSTKTVDFSKGDFTLKKVLDYVNDKTGGDTLNFYIDEDPDVKDKIDLNKNVNFKGTKITVRTILKKALNTQGLDYYLEDSIINITTKEEAAKHMRIAMGMALSPMPPELRTAPDGRLPISAGEINWAEYYRSHGYTLNGGSQRIQFAPVFVSPRMQWAVPNSSLWGPPRYFPQLSFDPQAEDLVAIPRTYLIGPLKHAPAAEVADVIRDTYREFIVEPRRVRLSIGVNNQTNSIVLNTSSGLHQEIKRFVEELEEAYKDSPQGARIQRMNGVDPQALQAAIDAMQGKSTSADEGPMGFVAGFNRGSVTNLGVGRVSPSGGGFGPGGGRGFGGGFPGGGFGGRPGGGRGIRSTLPDDDLSVFTVPRLPVTSFDIPGTPLIVITAQSQSDLDAGRRIFGSPAYKSGLQANDIITEILRVQDNYGNTQQPLLYERPTVAADLGYFTDLPLHAPGLNTNEADILAALEAESTLGDNIQTGQIDAAAKRLIDRARSLGWSCLTLGDVKFFVNGAGQFTFESPAQSASDGFREQVYCDGKTLVHLYPEIGLGSKRTVSRFHRAELAELVPWHVLPAEDLAIGADVKLVDERTVAIVALTTRGVRSTSPRGVEVHLVFAADGRLCERRLVETPGRNVIYRETYDAKGTIQCGVKDSVTIKLKVSPAEPQNVTPKVDKLDVIPMPLRTEAYWKALSEKDGKAKDEDRIASVTVTKILFESDDSKRETLAFVRKTYGDKPVPAGLLTLLGALPEPKGGFLTRLVEFRDLHQLWQETKTAPNQADFERTRKFLSGCRSPYQAWVLLDRMQRSGQWDDADFKWLTTDVHKRFGDPLGLAHVLRYEQACRLSQSGRQTLAQGRFRAMYAGIVKDGGLPVIDGRFVQAFKGHGGDEQFAQLIRQTSAKLVKEMRFEANILLARQLWQLGEQDLANEAFAAGLNHDFAGLKGLDGLVERAKFELNLAGIDFYCATSQWERADTILRTLLADERVAQHPAFWRLGVTLAARRTDSKRGTLCLEKALDLEFNHLPAAVDLGTIRSDYGELLRQYQTLATAYMLAETGPPPEFVQKVVRAADRWRSLDPETTDVCHQTAKILQTIGERELSWDYLTTPIGLKPNESGPWVSLAGLLQSSGDLSGADAAYAKAFETEPTNAQILWDRAENLQRLGQIDPARRLMRQIVDGTWQPRFQEVQNRAKAWVESGESSVRNAEWWRARWK